MPCGAAAPNAHAPAASLGFLERRLAIDAQLIRDIAASFASVARERTRWPVDERERVRARVIGEQQRACFMAASASDVVLNEAAPIELERSVEELLVGPGLVLVQGFSCGRDVLAREPESPDERWS